jgi:ligand-binding SRPBCC domain-containing protein
VAEHSRHCFVIKGNQYLRFMSFYAIRYVQHIPIPLSQAWDFFSSPENLATITPDYMQFRITSERPVPRAYAGQIITYIVKPLLGIPMRWMTEITHVATEKYFVDEQRIGPYRIWHHEHHFKATDNGVEMTDIVHYQLPLGWLGRLAHALFVRRQLENIFAYRAQKVKELLGG